MMLTVGGVQNQLLGEPARIFFFLPCDFREKVISCIMGNLIDYGKLFCSFESGHIAKVHMARRSNHYFDLMGGTGVGMVVSILTLQPKAPSLNPSWDLSEWRLHVLPVHEFFP